MCIKKTRISAGSQNADDNKAVIRCKPECYRKETTYGIGSAKTKGSLPTRGFMAMGRHCHLLAQLVLALGGIGHPWNLRVAPMTPAPRLSPFVDLAGVAYNSWHPSN